MIRNWLILGWLGMLPLAYVAGEAVVGAQFEKQGGGPVHERFELAFTATRREAALAWQQQARKRLFELVAAQTPRRSLDERPLDFRIDSSADRDTHTLHRASFQCNDGERRPCLWSRLKARGLSRPCSACTVTTIPPSRCSTPSESTGVLPTVSPAADTVCLPLPFRTAAMRHRRFGT